MTRGVDDDVIHPLDPVHKNVTNRLLALDLGWRTEERLREEGTSQSVSFQETARIHNTEGHRHARHSQRASGNHNCNHTLEPHQLRSSQSSLVSYCPLRTHICCILASMKER